jgi:hypothetical protein
MPPSAVIRDGTIYFCQKASRTEAAAGPIRSHKVMSAPSSVSGHIAPFARVRALPQQFTCGSLGLNIPREIRRAELATVFDRERH